MKQLYLSPDDSLNLIPFEILTTAEGKALIDEPFMITYVGAGRDIVRFTDKAVARDVAVLMADPDYDMGSEAIGKQAEALDMRSPQLRSGMSQDSSNLQFDRLTGTKAEADAIAQVIKDRYHITVKNYQDKEALGDVLYSTHSPRFLHLSTHGYFLKHEEVGQRFLSMWNLMAKEKPEDLGIENPMLLSGIALAGANTSLRQNRNEGLVSAEEILGLKLKGTELVVLSACETGVGDVKSGEGVFGLKRAFILSGAKTVVMSLWKIPSKETEELMTEFYTRMAAGNTKAEALKAARMSIKKDHPLPFYWGALVMVGNPQ
jgi:CHAT domain-containing protein